ncbi:Disease resistance protein RPP8 [Rhynchospora pubera]|uniref:Disease resistance protein RPP8 n=1 Tax=Rhynchospora pubera TaxID=906938 RepID=A0AAV8F8D1_9POAL|nr:Disease resistance protein RPP8 [Rhynchospora pubera]
MAEAIVSFVVGKLGDLIIKEVGQLGGVKSQVKQVQTELMNIKCYLASADSKQRKGDAESAQVENWLNQLRDVAYRIEDAIDIFYVELEGNHLQVENTHNRKKYRCYYLFGKLKNLRRKFMKVPGLHKLGIELADIQKELEDIFVSKDKYGLTPLLDQAGRGSEPVNDEHVLSKRRPAYQDVDETEIVGLDADRDNILKLLLSSEKTPRRAVITIVGTGGLGKTTLAQMVYKRVKAYFEYHTIFSVSQQYNLNDLLAKILGEVVDLIKRLEVADPEKKKVLELISKYDGFELKKQDRAFFISKIKILLSGIRYLIILDDVWDVKLWDRMQYALPDNKNGSRVLMTSRSIDVARLADPETKPYELVFLNDKESCDLLLKKARYYKNPIEVESSSDDLLELANKLSKKCKGLPLALIVLGGILSTRQQTYHDWKKVLDTMDWHQEGGDCMNVLAMSYEDMPYYLKSCFIYLASFPEDYQISARNLIYMWVAEGFIPEQGKKTLEETAEIFLEQLYERSMVQVSSRYSNGSIKSFRVHDLLHDLAMHEARKVNFVTIFQKLPQGSHPDRVTRRASIQADKSVHDCSEFIKYIGSNTRSLLLFDQRLGDSISVIDFRLLRVLEIEGDAHDFELRGLDGLIHLKYLGIRNSGLKLPNDFRWDRLKNLETLIGAMEEREGLWSIRTLRHVILNYVYFVGPPAGADLRNLQTLQWISSSCLKAWHKKNQLPLLNNLRKFGLLITDEIESVEWEMVGCLLATLPYLLSLKISNDEQFKIPKEIVYPRGLPNYQNLEILYLGGPWPDNVTVEASLFPPHLIKLNLSNSQFAVDPMPELGKLKSLKKLRLGREVYAGGKEMICPAGFPALQSLFLYCHIENFTVMEGVMPKLKHLDYSGIKLNLPPELEHLKRY